MEQQSSRKRLSKMSKFSVVLSYMVALFAILSLIAAGFSQISYAAPTTVDDTITFYQATKNGELISMFLLNSYNEFFLLFKLL